jgi:hypothetical protein
MYTEKMSYAQKGKNILANLKPKLNFRWVIRSQMGSWPNQYLLKKISCKYIFKYIIIASNQSTETEHGVKGCENLKILALCKI